MSEGPKSGVTELLLEWRHGSHEALDALTPIVYEELRRLAHRYMRKERANDVLQTTALVHEAYIRLLDAEVKWQDRLHFFAVAASLMRRILVDHSRRRMAAKRGGGGQPVTLEEIDLPLKAGPDLVALDDALHDLAAVDKRKSQVVELRFFGGLTIEETARFLDVSHATVERDLKVAKAWLSREMNRE
ncbi:MAG: sigma-70 family RNA polymerase sigma factor [Acidobacteriota bacterium]